MQLLQSNIDTFTSFPLLGYTVSSTVHSVHHHAICCCPSGRIRIAALMLSSSSLFLVRVFNLFRPAAASHPRLTPTRPPFAPPSRCVVATTDQLGRTKQNSRLHGRSGRQNDEHYFAAAEWSGSSDSYRSSAGSPGTSDAIKWRRPANLCVWLRSRARITVIGRAQRLRLSD